MVQYTKMEKQNQARTHNFSRYYFFFDKHSIEKELKHFRTQYDTTGCNQIAPIFVTETFVPQDLKMSSSYI